MATKSLRRRSSQYSLFPTCPPVPSQPVVASTNTSNNTANPILSWNNSSASDGKAADILARADQKEGQQRHSTEGKRINTDLTILRVINKLKRQSANMSQLIPLKLATRMSSLSMEALPARTISSPSTSPVYPPERPKIPSRTSSKRERPGPITELTILPYTQEEWRKIMEEVKDLYARGQYKHCSMRCKQIIKGIKDPYRVHPLYSIYLSFFAASSLEITASSLHNYSSAKLPLYQEALACYQKAESYIEYASFSTDPTVIPTSSRHSYAHPPRYGGFNPHQMIHHSSNSSMSSTSSIRSSTDSVFSHRSSSACSMASSFTSPTEQDSDIYALHHRTSSLSSRSSVDSFRPSQRHKKKVSFSFASAIPTMLSENDIPAASIDASILINSFPSPPSRSPSPPISPISSSNPAHTRYRLHLTDLSKQLQYHISSLHKSIAHLSSARAPRRSNGSDLTAALTSDESCSPRPRFDINSDIEQSEERQTLDIQARIIRLREAGWQRKRFDPTRYKNLCEKALDEVAESECF